MIGGRLFGWERTGVPMEHLRLHGVSYLIPIAGWWKRRVEAFLVLDQDSAFAVSYTDAACFDCHSKRNIMRNINMQNSVRYRGMYPSFSMEYGRVKNKREKENKRENTLNFQLLNLMSLQYLEFEHNNGIGITATNYLLQPSPFFNELHQQQKGFHKAGPYM